MRNILLGAVLLGSAVLATAAVADDGAELKARLTGSLTSDPNFKFPADRDALDHALDTNDYAFLLKRQMGLMKEEDVLLFMNWLKYRQLTGGGYLVNKMYATEQWRLGESYLKAGRPMGEKFKQAAVTTAVYAYLLTIADAPQCKDATAPSNRQNEVVTQLRPLFLFARTLPSEEREIPIRSGIQAERVIAPLRGNDDALCRGGMAEMQVAMDAMARSGKEPEAVTVPGVPGKTVLLSGGSQYKPEFVDPADWKPKRDALRNGFPDLMAALLTPVPATP